jgi:hypothetical protein
MLEIYSPSTGELIHVEERRPMLYVAQHAPAGYTEEHPLVIAGQSFVGGEFIPNGTLAKATPEQKDEIDKKGAKIPMPHPSLFDAPKETAKPEPHPAAKHIADAADRFHELHPDHQAELVKHAQAILAKHEAGKKPKESKPRSEPKEATFDHSEAAKSAIETMKAQKGFTPEVGEKITSAATKAAEELTAPEFAAFMSELRGGKVKGGKKELLDGLKNSMERLVVSHAQTNAIGN